MRLNNWHVPYRYTQPYYTSTFVHSADLLNRLRMPAVTLPGPSSTALSKSLAKTPSMVFSHRTGLVTWVARSFLMVAGSLWGLASTLEMTGMRGFLNSMSSSTFSRAGTAGAMKSVWKAPATASLTVMRALKSGLAISATTSQASLAPDTA